ncbi:MAG: TlpA family protein disulfide reductase [Sphingobacterium sp.]
MMEAIKYRIIYAFLWYAVVFYGIPCTAQSNESLKINGKITGNYIVDSMEISYTTNFEEQHNIFMRGRSKSFRVSENQFQVEIDSEDSLFYIKFHNIKNMGLRENSVYGRLVYFPVVVAPHMQLEMEVNQDSVIFSGKDAALINCQLELRRIEQIANRKIRESYDKNKLFQMKQGNPYDKMWCYLEEYHAINQQLLAEGSMVFNSFSKKSDEKAWQQLWYDWVGNLKYNQITKMHFFHTMYAKKYRNAIEDFYKKFLLVEDDLDMIVKYTTKSIMFPRYLYLKSYADLFFSLAEFDTELEPSFDTLLDLLSGRYKGELFDQVAFSALLQQAGNKYIDENTYLKLASQMGNSEIKRTVEEMLARKSKYRKGYDFALEDSEGQIRTPQDFKGKVLIMDFWYTGCHACKGLYKAMKPVKSAFATNSNVVVLSVCVDKSRERWYQTISDPNIGYTDSTNLNLCIGGETKHSPIIRYYDIFSYPTIIVLNGNNEIMAFNPKDPYTEIDRNAFISIIDQALKKAGG